MLKNGSPFQSSAPCNHIGFLQKNNNLEEKSGVVTNEQPTSNERFRHTETDFSNLFARGESLNISVIEVLEQKK